LDETAINTSNSDVEGICIFYWDELIELFYGFASNKFQSEWIIKNPGTKLMYQMISRLP